MKFIRMERSSWWTLGLALAFLAGIGAPGLAGQVPGAAAPGSQSPPATGMHTAPTTVPMPAQTPSGAGQCACLSNHDKELLVDFANLERFKAADAALPAPSPGGNRVVFMGDSITQGWNLDVSFPGKPYINRGISGQTTPQMLVRFRQDVINLDPKVVVILGGTNDIAGNTGPMTLEQTEENLASMADLASAHKIRVVLCSVTPSVNFWWAPGRMPAPKIALLNAWIRGYAAARHYVYVDYYSAMKDAEGGLPTTLSHDGVHPNPAGYAVMAPLAQAGIVEALHKK